MNYLQVLNQRMHINAMPSSTGDEAELIRFNFIKDEVTETYKNIIDYITRRVEELAIPDACRLKVLDYSLEHYGAPNTMADNIIKIYLIDQQILKSIKSSFPKSTPLFPAIEYYIYRLFNDLGIEYYSLLPSFSGRYIISKGSLFEPTYFNPMIPKNKVYWASDAVVPPEVIQTKLNELIQNACGLSDQYHAVFGQLLGYPCGYEGMKEKGKSYVVTFYVSFLDVHKLNLFAFVCTPAAFIDKKGEVEEIKKRLEQIFFQVDSNARVELEIEEKTGKGDS